MRYLGIDYGAKRIGVAISDEEGRVAFPEAVVPNDDRALDTISDLVMARGVTTVVIGESLDFQNKPNEIQGEIDKFVKKLEQKEMEFDIIFEPEFLTSAQAVKITGKNERTDASAAALILQSYLDKKNLL